MEPNPSLTGYCFKTSQRVDPFVLELLFLFAKWSLFQNTPTPWVITNNNSFVQGFALVTLCKLRIHFVGKRLAVLVDLFRNPLIRARFLTLGVRSFASWWYLVIPAVISIGQYCKLNSPCCFENALPAPTNWWRKTSNIHSSMFRKTHRLAKCVFSCLLVFVYALVYSAKYLTGQSRQQLMPRFYSFFFFFKYMLAFMDLFDVTVKTQKAKRLMCNMW